MLMLLLLSLCGSLSGGLVTDARYPAVSPDGSEIVYCWRGQLWSLPAGGSDPRCLTPGRGYVSHPAWSPDGLWIAFTSDITGSGDVYLMPSIGGVSRRLTFHGGEDRVLGWEGDNILFASSREGGDSWIWSVPVEGGTPFLRIPVSTNSVCVTESLIVIERGLTPWWRRHYSGSASSSLWSYADQRCTPLSMGEEDQRWPMQTFSGEIIHVLEDSLGFDRFFSLERGFVSGPLEGGVTFPSISADGRVVVYESAGELWRTDTERFHPERIPIPERVDLPFPLEDLFFAGVYTSDFAVAPDGSFLVMISEGDVYAAVMVDGKLENPVRVTFTDALESHPRISPDGGMLLFQSETDGIVSIHLGQVSITEDRIHVETSRIETGQIVSTQPEWSPSGAFSFLDSEGRLHAMDPHDGASRVLCEEKGILHHSWSPDSRWLAFSTTVEAHREDVFLVSAEGGPAENVSRHPNDDFQPVWPSDGRRLIWASRTDDGSYSIVQAWFDEDDWRAKRDEKDLLIDQPLETVNAHTRHLYLRTEELCRVEGYYEFFGITPDGRKIYFPATDPGGEKDLWSVDWDGENLTRQTHGSNSPTRIQPTGQGGSGAVFYLSWGSSLRNTDGDILSWSAPGSRNLESFQRQKFCSAWRMLRDSFYDPSMHGTSWEMMRNRYEDRAAASLLNRDFNDVVRRMLGELSASHLGIYGPWEYRRTAFTGETGIYPDHLWNGTGIRIDSILPMSPAEHAGLVPGDLVISIDGESVGRSSNFYAPLRNTAGRDVPLVYRRRGKDHETEITPVSEWDLWQLQYAERVDINRRRVAELSLDRVGYLHIPSMDQGSVSSFRRDLYAEGLFREAMIIDVRGNGGGHTHDQILASLDRAAYAFSRDRTGRATVEPLGVYRNPLVLVINETCYSDAEIFPAAWQELELGPVVGNRTYGAVIGTVDVQLADGTGFRLPGTGWYTLSGENLENRGVSPDVIVLEMPCDMALGIDRQLEKAVETALALIGD